LNRLQESVADSYVAPWVRPSPSHAIALRSIEHDWGCTKAHSLSVQISGRNTAAVAQSHASASLEQPRRYGWTTPLALAPGPRLPSGCVESWAAKAPTLAPTQDSSRECRIIAVKGLRSCQNISLKGVTRQTDSRVLHGRAVLGAVPTSQKRLK